MNHTKNSKYSSDTFSQRWFQSGSPRTDVCSIVLPSDEFGFNHSFASIKTGCLLKLKMAALVSRIFFFISVQWEEAEAGCPSLYTDYGFIHLK